ncbi:MAG TPA: glycosyltransferase family 1 protein [Candidatus Atribacteria bacterium]|nr:glycosyltransferase family 1 protein [Candidatus Atribacteria bacterium]
MKYLKLKKNSRLLVVGSDPVWKKNDKYFTLSPFNTFFSAFLHYFDYVSMALPFLGDKIQIKNGIAMPEDIEIVELPGFKGVIDFIRKSIWILPKLIPVLHKEIKKSDAVMVMHDDFLGLITLLQARKQKKPHLLFLGGNQVEVVRNKYTGLKRWGAIYLAHLFEKIDQYWMDHGLTVLVTGREMIERLSAPERYIYPYFTSLISDEDIIYRKPRDISSNSTNILYAGFLTENKGVHILLEAFARFREKYHTPDIKLHLAGDGYFRPKLEEICQQLKITENVIFYGFIGDKEKLKQLFREADMFVLPSKSEGIPKVLLEAMAYGVPILTTNVGGIPDIIEDGVNGLLIPPGSPGGFVKGMAKILFDAKLRQKLIDGGYHFIKEHTKEKQAKEIIEYLHRVYG